MIFKDKQILIAGGTGSLGRQLLKRILSFEEGKPAKIIIFSRDEAKQHQMRLDWKRRTVATDEIVYRSSEEILDFQIGDIRDYKTVFRLASKADIIINAAALKQVPTCEYFPYEAVRTNIDGAQNIVTAISAGDLKVEVVVGVSTDKACKPINVMGMSKAIQERILIRGNLDCPNTRFICVRYGNVLASRGSVIPLFFDQIACGGPVTITTKKMTRFLISLNQAVDLIFDAIRYAKRGETFIPRVPSANIVDLVDVLIADRPIEKKFTGIRPGEKIHEVLVSEEECYRTIEKKGYYVIEPILPELRAEDTSHFVLKREYTSAENVIDKAEIWELLKKNDLLDVNRNIEKEEILI